MKKYIKPISIILLVALAVSLLFVVISLIARKPNENNYFNLLYNSDASYVGESGKDENGITWTVKDDGTIVADGEASANTYFEIGTMNFAKGTYTFTANDNVDRNKFYVDGVDSKGVTVWYSDIENSENGMTQTFGEEMIVTFRIVVIEGTKLNNVKFRPCIVEGETAGEYYI